MMDVRSLSNNKPHQKEKEGKNVEGKEKNKQINKLREKKRRGDAKTKENFQMQIEKRFSEFMEGQMDFQ